MLRGSLMIIALYEPEIPQNTGNIIRLCANTGVKLSLVGPLGFTMRDKQLRRAGLDYHEYADIRRIDRWETLYSECADSRIVGFSSKAKMPYDLYDFQDSDVLLFGPETRGLPQCVSGQCDVLLRIPMMPESRSLNLSNSVAVVLYEALRQQKFPGME